MVEAICSNQPKPTSWWVYLVRTEKNILYCGITTNLSKRLATHQAGKGSKLLRGKGKLTLAWSCELNSKSSALKAEYRIKQLTKAQKEQLIMGKDNKLLAF